MIDIDALDFAKGNGLVTIVCQDARSGAVLMVAHANREALELTISSGEMHYWSRTRGLWRKGATSGNVQRVIELRQDCDADAVLARVEQVGVACHTGTDSCFGDLGSAAGILTRLDSVISERAVRLDSDRSSSGAIESLRGAPPTVGDNIDSRTESQQSTATAIKNAPSESPTVGDNSKARDEHHQSSASDTESRSYTARLLTYRNLRLKKIGEEAAEFVTACADGDRERAVEEAADLIYHTLVALRATGAGLRDVERVLATRHRTGAADTAGS